MFKLQILKGSKALASVEIPETFTVSLHGHSAPFDVSTITDEGLHEVYGYGLPSWCKRSAPKKGSAKAECVAHLEESFQKLSGKKPIGDKRSADPVASRFRGLAIAALESAGAYKKGEVPKLGTTVDQIKATLVGMGRNEKGIEAILGKARKLVEAEQKAKTELEEVTL